MRFSWWSGESSDCGLLGSDLILCSRVADNSRFGGTFSRFVLPWMWRQHVPTKLLLPSARLRVIMLQNITMWIHFVVFWPASRRGFWAVQFTPRAIKVCHPWCDTPDLASWHHECHTGRCLYACLLHRRVQKKSAWYWSYFGPRSGKVHFPCTHAYLLCQLRDQLLPLLEMFVWYL